MDGSIKVIGNEKDIGETMNMKGKSMRKNKIDITKVDLTDEQKKMLMDEIHKFFLTEYDEEIEIIKQQRILDLFMEELAAVIYNKALDDVMMWYKRQQDNMEADFYTLYKEG